MGHARARAARPFAASGPGDRESPTAQPVAAPAPIPNRASRCRRPRWRAAAGAGCHPAALRRETLEGAHRGISRRAARESPSGRAPERLGSARQALTEELTRSAHPPDHGPGRSVLRGPGCDAVPPSAARDGAKRQLIRESSRWGKTGNPSCRARLANALHRAPLKRAGCARAHIDASMFL